MCRNTTNCCILCHANYQWNIPCDRRIEDSPTSTLTIPTSCIDSQVVTFTYHNDCMDRITNQGTDPNTALNSGQHSIPSMITSIRVCSELIVNTAPDGGMIWHPHQYSINRMNGNGKSVSPRIG